MDTEDELEEKKADAVYHDLIEFKRLKRLHKEGGYLFPYGGEVYWVTTVGVPKGWSVWLYKVFGDEPVAPITGGCPTRRGAIKDTVRYLHGTKCGAGYIIGQDSCPHCDAEVERFEHNYGS